MSTLRVHTIESAPEGSRETLAQTEKALGFVPNLFGVFAESPALLKAYASVGALFDSTSFTPTERQVVLLSVSLENECDYCMAAHSTIAQMQKLPEEVVAALRNDEPIADPKLQALSVFTRRVVRRNGWVSSDDVQEFLGAGFGQAQILDVILGVGMKILSNYTNHIGETPLDSAFQPQVWTAPQDAPAA